MAEGSFQKCAVREVMCYNQDTKAFGDAIPNGQKDIQPFWLCLLPSHLTGSPTGTNAAKRA